LEQAVNVVAIGKPGVGKSHVLAALGYELILSGHAVCWTPTSTLVQRLLAAKRDLRLPQELAKLDKYACVILDDIGYIQHDRDEMEVLFTFLSERYERKSVLISTNLVWSRMGTHVQKSDDHHGCHRPCDPPLCHFGYDGRRQLSCTSSYPSALATIEGGTNRHKYIARLSYFY
jgi:DNA replication protein DnaC